MPERKCVIVAVCGSSGAGKSTFALALGRALARRRKVVCISPDPACPALSFWLPDQVPPHGMERSLGALLQYSVIDLEAVAGCLIPDPHCPDLALMGMELGCYPGRYGEPDPSAVGIVLDMIRREVDYIVVDCVTDIPSDPLSRTAFTSADCAVCLLTPDCKGLSWLEMARAEGLDLSRVGTVFCPVLRESPLDELREKTGGTVINLPFSDEVALRICSGAPLTGFQKQAGRYYEKAVRSFAAALASGGGKKDG